MVHSIQINRYTLHESRLRRYSVWDRWEHRDIKGEMQKLDAVAMMNRLNGHVKHSAPVTVVDITPPKPIAKKSRWDRFRIWVRKVFNG